MSMLIDIAIIYPLAFVAAYFVIRYNQNDFTGARENRIEAVKFAAIAAMFLSAAIIVPGGQSEL